MHKLPYLVLLCLPGAVRARQTLSAAGQVRESACRSCLLLSKTDSISTTVNNRDPVVVCVMSGVVDGI